MITKSCKECGSTQLTWFCGKTNRYGPQDGMLSMHDVGVQFFLRCEECSETLQIVSDDAMLKFLNGLKNKNIEIDIYE